MKIYVAKNGRRYIKLANGRAKFIKGKTKIRTNSKFTAKRGTTKMAKRRYKKKNYRKKSGGMFGRLNRPLVGGAMVVAYEAFISPRIPLQGVVKDGVELLAGYWCSKKKGAIGAFGNSMMVINSYQLLSNAMSGSLKGLFGSKADTYNYN